MEKNDTNNWDNSKLRIKIDKKWQKALFMSVGSVIVLCVGYIIALFAMATVEVKLIENHFAILYGITGCETALLFITFIVIHYVETIKRIGIKSTLKEFHSFFCIAVIVFLVVVIIHGMNSTEYKSVPINLKAYIILIFIGTNVFFYFFWSKVPEKWMEAAYKYLY